MNKESFFYVVFFTFLVTFVFVFVLTLAGVATADRVQENQELVIAEAVLSASGMRVDEDENILEVYEKNFGDEAALMRAEVDGRTVLVKQFSGQGLWGTVTGVLAVTEDFSRIVGLDIIGHAETPGLGGRIDEDGFKNQFRDERILPGGITVRKGEGGTDADPDNGLVDGITGASLTSAAMQVIINNEIESIRKELSE